MIAALNTQAQPIVTFLTNNMEVGMIAVNKCTFYPYLLHVHDYKIMLNNQSSDISCTVAALILYYTL